MECYLQVLQMLVVVTLLDCGAWAAERLLLLSLQGIHWYDAAALSGQRRD